MPTTHLWYTCCIDKATVPSWNVAVMPSYNGKVTSKMHGDTFAILGGTKHPKEAFKVYTYMLTTGSADLYQRSTVVCRPARVSKPTSSPAWTRSLRQ
ncbi:MAG: hypothetical protein IPO15_19945 [Anaerolineae bacterium]|uniref:hypothetical protein n=1 Tax=Candidatus Amarolinea dominans TaxID=3140696 RepID=UPI003134F72A|nr:hypothetical protein [Anaerolineae bacterium]